MQKTLHAIRFLFILLCTAGGWLVCYAVVDWDEFRFLGALIGLLVGVLVVLVDVLLKGFSLRGLSAVTFGLGIGALISWFLTSSPLFAFGDPALIHLSRMSLFIITTYICTVVALRGKDEFNLIIPYVRFVPQEVETPLVIVDTSALIDGRISRVCESGFLPGSLVIPQFVLNELQSVADAADPQKQARGRRGLDVLNELRRIKHIDIRIVESDVSRKGDVDAKLVFLAQSMKARLLTLDYNLVKMAEFHGVACLNLGQLSKALMPEIVVGEQVDVELVKSGKEEGQAVGYLSDGSMVVVSQARAQVGRRVVVEIASILPSAGGKMVFARFIRVAE